MAMRRRGPQYPSEEVRRAVALAKARARQAKYRERQRAARTSGSAFHIMSAAEESQDDYDYEEDGGGDGDISTFMGDEEDIRGYGSASPTPRKKGGVHVHVVETAERSEEERMVDWQLSGFRGRAPSWRMKARPLIQSCSSDGEESGDEGDDTIVGAPSEEEYRFLADGGRSRDMRIDDGDLRGNDSEREDFGDPVKGPRVRAAQDPKTVSGSGGAWMWAWQAIQLGLSPFVA